MIDKVLMYLIGGLAHLWNIGILAVNNLDEIESTLMCDDVTYLPLFQ